MSLWKTIPYLLILFVSVGCTNGFFGSKPFSRINGSLRGAKKRAIDWQIPDL